MQTIGIFAKKLQYLVLGLFIVVTLSPLSYAEIDAGTFLSIWNKGELSKIADEAEKVYEKNPKDKDNLTKLGIAYHNLAVLEVKGASGKAAKYLSEATKLYPEDALLLALLGSSMSMVGRDEWNIITKKSKANEGFGFLDKAVTMAPDNVVIRRIRANNSLQIPASFGRQKIAKGDLLHIEGIIQKAPKEGTVGLQTEVYYKLGNIFKSEKDSSTAKAYFKKAAELSPDSEWGKKAKKEL